MFKRIIIKRMSNIVEVSQETPIIKKKGSPAGSSNKTHFHWNVVEDGRLTSYRTLAELKEVYGIHRGTAYLIAKNPDKTPRKYKHIMIKKETIHEHLVPAEQKYQ